jgi:zinc transporter 1/2/3
LISAPHPPRRHHTEPSLYNHHLPAKFPGVPVEVLHNSPRICRLTITKDRVHGHDEYGVDVGFEREGRREEERPRIGRRRQVIGILVLQLGIMIHSFVIGMTLAITTGTDFSMWFFEFVFL